MPDISSLSLHPDNNGFSLNTKKHGIVDFSHLSVWRMSLIIENTKKMQNIEPSEFCLIVAKYLISKKENIVYDEEYYKKNKTYNNIKLILEKTELDNFAKKFVSIYKTEISNYIDLNSNNKLDNHKIIKMYFFRINEEYVNLVERTTKFTNLSFDNKLFDQVKKISELTKMTFPKFSSDELNRITEAAKVFSSIPPSEITKLSEAVKSTINVFPFDNIKEINEKEEQLKKATNPDITHLLTAPIIPHRVELEVLCETKDLFNSFITNFNSFKEYIKSMLEVTNTTINNIRDSIELQINENAKTSNKAFFLSIIAIIIAIAIGVAQIFFSLNSNKHTDKMNFNIEQLNNTIIDLNITNKNYLEKIEILTNEIIHQNEIKSYEKGENSIP
jgi:hypothetical protein